MLNRFLEVISCFRQTSQWLLITLDYARLRRLRFPYDLRLRSGQDMTLLEHTDVIIFWLVFVRHHYPVKPSDQTILDVGANIGMFTLYAASRAPGARIIAIEPFPDTCTRLRSCIERNRLSSRVTILNFALTNASTTGSMDIGEVPSQYRRLYNEATQTLNQKHRNMVLDTPGGVAVESKTLHQALQIANVGQCDLMKLNVHGCEYEILLSTPAADLQLCKRIVVQYHDMPAGSNLSKEVIFTRLQEIGFKLKSDCDTQRGSGLAVLEL